MDLNNVLLPEKTVSFEFPGCDGFSVDLAYLSKEEHRKILESCRKNVIDKKTRQVRSELDNDLFLEKYVEAIIKDWSGFKGKYLKELVLVDDNAVDDDEEVNYTVDNAVILMKNSNVFDDWVAEQISDLGKFSTNSTKKKSPKSKVTSKTAATE